MGQGNSAVRTSNRDEMLKHKWQPAVEAEPEERRMSDLSDWASSVTSSVDVQVIAPSGKLISLLKLFSLSVQNE